MTAIALTPETTLGQSTVSAFLHGALPPVNDNFVNATTLLLDVAYPGFLDTATVEPTEFDNYAGGGFGANLRLNYPRSSWYKYRAVADGGLHVSMTSSYTDGVHFSLFCLIWQGTGSGDTIDNVVNIGVINQFGPLDFTALTGNAFYFQVFSNTENMDFALTLTGAGAAPWTVQMDATSAVQAGLREHYGMSSAIHGHASMVDTVAINSLYANAHGHAAIVPVLSEDANPNVLSYTGDPRVGAGGTVTAATGPYPNIYNNVTAVALIETVGAAGTDSKLINNYLTLFASDRHGIDGVNDYYLDPLPGDGSGVIYSCERWFRVRFQGPFNYVDGLRMWTTTDIATLRPGWTIKFGTTDTYTAPTVNPSSVATTNLAYLTDPGAASRNLMDTGPVTGTSGDYLSKWVVVQAKFDPTIGGPGPLLGFTSEGSIPLSLQLLLAWAES